MQRRESQSISPLEEFLSIRSTNIEHAARIALDTNLPVNERQKQFEWLKQEAHNTMVEIGVMEDASHKRRANNAEYVNELRTIFNRIMEILPLIHIEKENNT